MNKINKIIVMTVVFCVMGTAYALKCSKAPFLSGDKCSNETAVSCNIKKTLRCSNTIGGDVYTEKCGNDGGFDVQEIKKNKKCTDVYDLNKNCTNDTIQNCIKKRYFTCTTEFNTGTCYQINGATGVVTAEYNLDSCASEYSGQPVWEGTYIQAKES